jgi:phage/plasmid-associated DNA primase
MFKAATYRLAEPFYASHCGQESHKRLRCILPTIIDTPANRKVMPAADYDTRINLKATANEIVSWCQDLLALYRPNILVPLETNKRESKEIKLVREI